MIFSGLHPCISSWRHLSDAELSHRSDIIVLGVAEDEEPNLKISVIKTLKGNSETKLPLKSGRLYEVHPVQSGTYGLFFLQRSNSVYRIFHPRCYQEETNYDRIETVLRMFEKPIENNTDSLDIRAIESAADQGLSSAAFLLGEHGDKSSFSILYNEIIDSSYSGHSLAMYLNVLMLLVKRSNMQVEEWMDYRSTTTDSLKQLWQIWYNINFDTFEIIK